MRDRHINWQALKAKQANTLCKMLITDAWQKRMFFEEPTLWLALVLPVAKARPDTTCKATSERPLNDFDATRLANIMQAYAPCVKKSIATALERGVADKYEKLLDTLAIVWEPFFWQKRKPKTPIGQLVLPFTA